MSAQNNGGKFIIIEDWMFDLKDENGKRLTDTSLHLYALLYGFSKHRVGYFFGRRTYFLQRLHTSVSAVRNSLKQLLAAKLIEEIDKPKQGSTIAKRKWATIMPKDGSLPESSSEGFTPIITAGQSTQKLPEISSSPESSSEGARCQILTVSYADSTHVTSLESTYEDAQNSLMSTGGNEAVNKGFESNIENKILSSHTPAVAVPSSAVAVRTTELNGEDGIDYENEINTLMDASLNKRASYSEIEEAYLEAIAKGYTPEQIEHAFCRKYAERYREANPKYIGYAMRLDNYLRDSRGLRFDAPTPKNSRRATFLTNIFSKDKDASLLSLDAFASQFSPNYNETCKAYRQATMDLLKEQSGKQHASPRQKELSLQVQKLQTDLEKIRKSCKSAYSDYLAKNKGVM